MKDKREGRRAVNHYPQLDGEIAILHGDLNEVITSAKKETIIELRKSLSMNKDHPRLRELQKEKLDVMIYAYVQKSSYLKQDVDNIAKVVLDALKKPTLDDGLPYFFENDNQIIRLLVCKEPRKEDLESNTCQISVSIRKHDSFKEMELFVKPYVWSGEFYESVKLSEVKSLENKP